MQQLVPHPADPVPQLLTHLRGALGDGAVLDDPVSRAFYANDIFWQPGVLPDAIVCPATPGEAAEAIRLACDAGLAVIPRGGGMSYSKGCLPATTRSIVVEATRLTRIIEVNLSDAYITVEAGCTWADVEAALKGSGWRAAFWGPLSGSRATVGGTLAQNGAFYGSAAHGSAGDSVLSLTVVLPNGAQVTTGSAARRGAAPFTRDGGPDMTGLFVGDNGALGFKVAATLRLAPRPAHGRGLSFGFASLAAGVRAQAALARVAGTSEIFGIDSAKIEQSASFGGVAGAAPVLQDQAFCLHLSVEAGSADELEATMAAVRTAAGREGVEIDPAVANSLRAHPFGLLRGILGRNGERWVPVHGLFPISQALDICQASQAFLAAHAALMQSHGIRHSLMTMTVGHAFFLEPSFYWLDEITPLHVRTLGDDVVAPWRGRPADLAAREAVVSLRRGVQKLFAGRGGVSWQVARDYPFREVMDPMAYRLLSRLKAAIDPQGLMNPGALGLGGSDASH
ncbi:FAD-binding oxidoreductase [Mesorhizobium sp. B1-1-7]|uniref:FAD-binding oxidoreductase n=1 Tax=Mesorhizobium sp. B1-1-7 TaxID=2589977 RepID=UPI00112CF34F|nr:FAD-binding oxidoreductase [Mesorhizobium sp. B1-1-7]TPN43340.1 FAD-binding oxidoreductase [Mesorhizobium sp. B1-1-7]